MIEEIWNTVQGALDTATAIGIAVSFLALLVAGAWAAFSALTNR